MDINLYPFQKDFIDNIFSAFKDHHRRVIGVAPCGSGKTVMAATMIQRAIKKGHTVVFLVHRAELIQQAANTLAKFGIPFGKIISGEERDLSAPVQIASVQTLVNRLDDVPEPKFIICDECHHITAETYQKILRKWSNAWLLGLTATPLRLTSSGKFINLHNDFDIMIMAPDVSKLIKAHHLANYNYYAPYNVDFSGVKLDNFGEFNQKDIAETMKTVVGDTVQCYCDYALNKSAICYCVNIEHSKLVAESFCRAWINAAHIDGTTPKAERAKVINDFREGKIKVLCNVDLLGEGFDVPNMEAVILARPTMSPSLYTQQAMRPMRIDPNNPNKIAIIIDQVRNCERHGKPATQHDWSLDPNPEVKIQHIVCEKCNHHFDIPPVNTFYKGDFLWTKCPKCGNNIKLRKKMPNEYVPHTVKFENGDLHLTVSDIDGSPAKLIIRTVIKPTIERLLDIASRRHHKTNFWAATEAAKCAKTLDECYYIAIASGYQKGCGYHLFKKYAKKNLNLGLEKTP